MLVSRVKVAGVLGRSPEKKLQLIMVSMRHEHQSPGQKSENNLVVRGKKLAIDYSFHKT